MSVVAIIPAWGGSERLPRRVVLSLRGLIHAAIMRDPGVDAARLPLKTNRPEAFPAGRYDLEDPRWLLEYAGYKLL